MDSKKKNPFTDLTNSGFIKIRMTTLSIAFEGETFQRHKEMLVCLNIKHAHIRTHTFRLD